MIVTVSLITKQNPLFVRASDNRVLRHWSMINLTFCTWWAPLNSGRGLLYCRHYHPVVTEGNFRSSSTWLVSLSRDALCGHYFQNLSSLAFLVMFLPLFPFFFTLLPLNSFKHLTSSASTSPCKFNHIQDVSLEEITNKLISRILFSLT